MTTLRTFDKAPSSLGLYVKAALPVLPGVGALPGIKHTGSEAPDLVLAREGVTVDPDRLEGYNEVCGYPLGDTLPPLYPHLDAFGLHMALMTDTSFPFVPMGLVHLRNSLTQHRPIHVDETFDLEVRAQDLRPHPKGRLIDVLTEATIDGDLVWEETMTLFSRGKGKGEEPTPAPLDGVEAPSGVVHWKTPGDLGRRYGAVSGDRNPIHLYPVTAKAFGFPTNIAHGMWTKARSLAALHSKLPDAFRVDVEFRKPVLLPGTVVFGTRQIDGGWEFGVVGKKKPVTHLVGRVTAV